MTQVTLQANWDWGDGNAYCWMSPIIFLLNSEGWWACDKLHIFKDDDCLSSDMWIDPWNHHHSQNREHIHHPQKLAPATSKSLPRAPLQATEDLPLSPQISSRFIDLHGSTHYARFVWHLLLRAHFIPVFQYKLVHAKQWQGACGLHAAVCRLPVEGYSPPASSAGKTGTSARRATGRGP